MQAFGTSERAAVDAAHSAATVGLVSRADFLAARDRAEAQAEAEAEAKKAAGVAASEKARDAQRAARDAQRKRERAALSFAADDDSDEVRCRRGPHGVWLRVWVPDELHIQRHTHVPPRMCAARSVVESARSERETCPVSFGALPYCCPPC